MLKVIFEWEERIKKQLSTSVDRILSLVQDGDSIFDIDANVGE